MHWKKNHLSIFRIGMRGSSLFWYFIGAFAISQVIIIVIFHVNAPPPSSPIHPQNRHGQQQQQRQRVSSAAVSRRAPETKRHPPDTGKHTVRKSHGALVLREETHKKVPANDDNDDSIQATARAYANSFTKLGRGPLNFFHVPKTAGTAIEEAAAKQSIPWGSCRFYHKPKRDICPYPSGPDWPQYVGWWHLPAYLFPLVGSNPYQFTDLFAVVRDPYERMISEFYYICTLKIKDWRPDQCDNRTRLFDESYMNQWLHKKVQEWESQTAAEYYLADNSHFTPQHEFLVGPHQVRVVDYVLRMDDPDLPLTEQFTRLMKAYNMPSDMTLPFMGAISAGARNTTDHLTVDNLRQSTLDRIRHHYEKDLEYLRYEARDSRE
eukprot:scaffold2120_cov169-Amphora_coffeaeformis.AAC.19